MGSAVQTVVETEAVRVTLSGWDRAMNRRRSVVVELRAVVSARVADRSTLEDLIDHRARGCGTHNGKQRPNRRRVGTMLGRGVSEKQFWAVPASAGAAPLLVLDMREGEFERVVVAVDDPEAAAARIERARESA